MLALLIQVLYKGYVAFNAANSIRCQSGEGAQIIQGVLDCHHAHSCLGVTEDVKLAPLEVDNRAPLMNSSSAHATQKSVREQKRQQGGDMPGRK